MSRWGESSGTRSREPRSHQRMEFSGPGTGLPCSCAQSAVRVESSSCMCWPLGPCDNNISLPGQSRIIELGSKKLLNLY
jgi:hypothetical protein